MVITKNGWLQAFCLSPSRSRFQFFPSHVTPTYNYFPMIEEYLHFPGRISRHHYFPYRFQYRYGNSYYQNFPVWFQYLPTSSPKAFQKGCITFQLAEPKLSNVQYQDFPTFMLILTRDSAEQSGSNSMMQKDAKNV